MAAFRSLKAPALSVGESADSVSTRQSLRPSAPASVHLIGLSFLAVPNTLVECVPNFSEGRDKAKVDAIVEAMKIHGVFLLDREMDADHNRCVITLVGEREADSGSRDSRCRQGCGVD